MSIVVMGAVFVDIKGYPLSSYIPGGRNAGRVVPHPVYESVLGDYHKQGAPHGYEKMCANPGLLGAELPLDSYDAAYQPGSNYPYYDIQCE